MQLIDRIDRQLSEDSPNGMRGSLKAPITPISSEPLASGVD